LFPLFYFDYLPLFFPFLSHGYYEINGFLFSGLIGSIVSKKLSYFLLERVYVIGLLLLGKVFIG
jgi:hypothetical protein